MATGVTKTDPGELVVSSASSVAAVPKTSTPTVLVASGVSLALVPAPFDSELSVGFGTPVDAAFVPPTLDVWRILGSNDGVANMTVHPDTTTGGVPCTIQFLLEYGRNSAVFTISTPEQNNPHAATAEVDNILMFDKLCDLSWRWWSGTEELGAWELVAEAAVMVPGIGSPPSDNGE